MGKYRSLGSFLDRVFRNDLNANFNDVDTDITAQKKRVDDLIIAVPQPSEVVDARGGFPVLRDRLDGVATSLAQKAAQADLNTTNANLSKKSLRQSYLERQRNKKQMQKYNLPTTFGFTPTIKIFSDGFNFITDYNKEKFKNVSTTTYYISPTGLNTNDGLTENTPFLSFSKFISVAANNDTLVMLEGDYFRDSIDSTNLTKNYNIIGRGKVRLFLGNKLTYTKTAGYNYVYQTVRSNVFKVIDTAIDENGIELTSVSSIADCDATPGSYYFVSPDTLYIHAYNSQMPTNSTVALLVTNSLILSNLNQNINFYMENVKIFGGQSGTFTINPESLNTMLTCLDNVGLFHVCGTGENANLLNGYAGTIICNQCTALYSEKDGFNYKKTSLTLDSSFPAPNFIEINCIGANNGLKNRVNGQDATHNGSTAHNSCLGIRINGSYYNNMGANVADVGTGCKTVNLGCESYDSACTYNNEKSADFTAQQSGAEMWLDSCKAYNSKSKFNIYAIGGTTMHVWNTMFDVITGTGTRDEVNSL